ncbi:MAG: T9SS C-terminal target domain-containing protein [Cytophagales bacterium]|nr:MAG: T9SS C-terminal target domain-containing protein [Cytophagales bacterium]TAF59821.1 MAG: T9SS C-terminal target domain-containing protein [Cytophagales bacterium]
MMNKNKVVASSILLLMLLALPQFLWGQIVGTNAYLDGKFVEMGINRCGVYGANAAPPPGYNPNVFGLFGFVADSPKNGWGTPGPGALPNFCGDYFTPGSPEEGWGVQANGTSYANTSTGCFTPGGALAMPGGLVSHVVTGDSIIVVWQGTTTAGAAAGLRVRITTRVITDSLFIVGLVDITNTTAAPMNNLFFARNVDPDNDVQWPGGSFSTTNTVVDRPSGTADQTALVRAVSNLGCFLGLGARDCRARASWGCFSTEAPISNYFNGVSGPGCFFPARSIVEGATTFCDCAISIGFSLGTINPGETITISYAYILSDQDLPIALRSLGFRLPQDQIICKGDSDAGLSFPVTLKAPGGYDSYLWSDGSTADSLIVNGPGLYWGEGTVFIPGTGIPCSQRDSVLYIQRDPFVLNRGKNTELTMNNIYIGDSVVTVPVGFRTTIDAAYPASDTVFRWYRQDAYPVAPFAYSDSVTFTSPGDYILQVDIFPCSVFDTIRVLAPIEPGFSDPYVPVLTGEAGYEKAYLSWNAAEPEQGIAAYDIFGYDSFAQLIKVGRTTETNFVVPSLLNGTSYSFVMKPVLADLNGNPSFDYGTISNMVTVKPSIILGQDGAVNEKINLSLFPNPSKGVFLVKADGKSATFKNIKVINTMGQTVFEQNLQGTKDAFETTIQLEQVASGIYMVKVETDKGVYLQKAKIVR